MNSKQYQFSISNQDGINRCTFLDGKLMAFTEERQTIKTMRNKYYAKSSSVWSAWKTIYVRDGNFHLDSLTVFAIMAVLGMIAGTIGSAVLGIATAVATYKDHTVYDRQWVQKRYSKYNTTETRTITQYYKDQAHKKPIGDKVYSKPIMS